MTSKLNIFNSLPQHASDSEDETTAKNAKTRINKEKQEQRKQEHSKGIGHGHPAPKNAGEKEDVTRQKQAHKTKGVSGEPHPQDRQSGTGSQAYGAKPKKAGAGKGNWGNFKEDRRPAEEGEEVESPEVVEEEKPEGQTLAEYLASKRTVESAPQVNEAKSKITSEQLMKEVGKATLMKNRVQQDIDDKKVGKKKGKLDVDHHAGINTEHSDLLNFRTGFVEKEYRERVRGEEGTTAPRKFAPRREKAEEAPATETPAVEGEQPAEATTEGKTEEKTAEKTTEKRREGGNRGGRGGYQKGGDRAERGERRPYQGNKPSAAKVNFEDEALFPKLG